MKYSQLKHLILCDNPTIDPMYNDYYKFLKREAPEIFEKGYDQRFPKNTDRNMSELFTIIDNEKRLEIIRKLESIKTLPEEKKMEVIQDSLEEYSTTYRPFCLKNGGLYKNWLLDDW